MPWCPRCVQDFTVFLGDSMLLRLWGGVDTEALKPSALNPKPQTPNLINPKPQTTAPADPGSSRSWCCPAGGRVREAGGNHLGHAAGKTADVCAHEQVTEEPKSMVRLFPGNYDWASTSTGSLRGRAPGFVAPAPPVSGRARGAFPGTPLALGAPHGALGTMG